MRLHRHAHPNACRSARPNARSDRDAYGCAPHADSRRLSPHPFFVSHANRRRVGAHRNGNSNAYS